MKVRLPRILVPKPIISEIIWQILVPIAFITFVFLFYPFRDNFGRTDEGINVMKAMLVSMDYSLYEDIWNDQPPILTHILAYIFQLFGYKVNIGRLVIIVLSGILFWAYFQFMRVTWGKAHALAGTVTLILLPSYVDLSTSIMIGVPALSFAMVSVLFFAFWYRHKNQIWLILSAGILSFSVLTKLFTGLLAPIFIILLVIDGLKPGLANKNLKKIFLRLQPALIWGSVFAIVTGVLAINLIGIEHVHQILTPHVEAREVAELQDMTIDTSLGSSILTLLLAQIGVYYSINKQNFLSAIPIAWTIVAYVFLSDHSPVWTHQKLLVTIPAAMLAGVATAEGIQGLFAKKEFNSFYKFKVQLNYSSVLIFILLLLNLVPAFLQELKPSPSITTAGLNPTSNEVQFLKLMQEKAPQTEFVITDLPLFAFWAGLPVPPELAVFSSKRLVTGNLSEEHLIQLIKEYQPEQILFGRFNFPRLNHILDTEYDLVRTRESMNLYFRKSLE